MSAITIKFLISTYQRFRLFHKLSRIKLAVHLLPAFALDMCSCGLFWSIFPILYVNKIVVNVAYAECWNNQ